MASHQTIRYGNQEIAISLPEEATVQRLEVRSPTAPQPAERILQEALNAPVGAPQLRDIARGKDSAAILIPGATRIAGTRHYIPALLEELGAGGVPEENIEVFLATGTHERHLESDIESILGQSVAGRVRCLAHNCDEDSDLVELGTTSFGTPVFLNRSVLETDIKVLTGRIVPHYFAGYSGGRKAMIPGVAGRRTIEANHRLTLGPNRGIHPGAKLCNLADNPVHLDMVEAARLAQPDFCLSTLLDADHHLIGAVAGDWELSHEQVCQQAQELFCLTLEEPVDVLITSAGGLPYDCNFMQALKAVFNLQEIVRPGGAILWLAECPQGIKPGFLHWAAIESDDELDRAVRQDYNLTGHNSIMLRQLVRKADVALYSALPTADVQTLGLHPVASPSDGLRWITERFGTAFTCAVAPHANVICAQLAGTSPATH